MSGKRLRRELREYLAADAAWRYGPIEEETPRKVRRNLRRRFGTDLSLDVVREWLAHYKAMYQFAARILAEHLDPPKGKYVDWSDVRREEYLDAIACEYPGEPRTALGIVAKYAIFYEYLK